MTKAELMAESLRRVQLSDNMMEDYKRLLHDNYAEAALMYHEISHLRQTAAVYAALAIAS